MKAPNLSVFVSAAVTPQDKDLLRRIAEQDGDSGESATLRRLIRNEARSRGLLPSPAPVTTVELALPTSA